MIPVRRSLGGYDPSAVAIFNAFTTAPTTQRRLLINKLVEALKIAEVWPLLDCFYVFAAHDSAAALINWKNPGTFNASITGTPTFTTDQGFTGDGSTGYINSNFNPTSANGNWQQNSAHVSARSLTAIGAASNTQRLIGDAGTGTTSRVVIIPWNTGNTISALLNGATTTTLSSTTSLGHFLGNRSGASAVQEYRNGASLGSTTDASVSLLNDTPTFLHDGFNGSFATLQVASGSLGGSLTPAQVLALYAAEHAYMLGVGAVLA